MEWHDTQPESRVCLGPLELLLDGLVEAAVEEKGVIVASGTPLGGLGPDDILHVLDGLPVPLVVERGEVVGRRVPLIEDLAVAAGAVLALHEEVGGDLPADVRLDGGGEEGPFGPCPSPSMLTGTTVGLRMTIGGPRHKSAPREARRRNDDQQPSRQGPEAERHGASGHQEPGEGPQQKSHRGSARENVREEQEPKRARGSREHEHEPREKGQGRHGHCQGPLPQGVTSAQECRNPQGPERQPQSQVEDDVAEVEESRIVTNGEVGGVRRDENERPGRKSSRESTDPFFFLRAFRPTDGPEGGR